MSRIHVYPAPGLQVAIPLEERRRGGPTHLPATGAPVSLTTYWRRRLAAADVTTEPTPAPAPEA